MTALHLYCVRRAGDAPPRPSLRGVGDEPVILLEEEGLGLWASAGGDRAPDVESLRQHDRVVRDALQDATPVPFRFGQTVPDEAAARDLLRARGESFRSALQRVEGRVEVAVRVGWDTPAPDARTGGKPSGDPEAEDSPVGGSPDGESEDGKSGARDSPAGSPDEESAVGDTPPGDSPPGDSPGRAFLETRRRALRSAESRAAEAEARLDEVESAFAELRLPTVRKVLAAAGVAGTLAHLVHQEELLRYRQFAADLRKRRPELRITFSGPWAPYSFVADEEP
jgi:hypothetical protein